MRPPPGPFRPEFWRSPLRGTWTTTVLGLFLLAGVTVVALTGFLSHAAYEPDLPGNAIVPAARDLPLTFDWPTSPTWLYALNQGLHVNLGLATIPFLLAKLWSVIPRLFTWPPARGPLHGLERLSIALLVGSAIFQFATGVVNMQNWYPFGFNFVVAHYFGAVVFVASLVIHVVVKLPTMRVARRERDALVTALTAVRPAEPTLSRRGLLAFAGAGSATLLLGNVGETIGGPLRKTALLAPRREAFPVNKTARAAGVTREMIGAAWRLELAGGRELSLSRDELLVMDLVTEELPIACVEGWTTTQTWTGVPLSELAALAGADGARRAFVRSLQPRGVLASTSLSADAIADGMLALRVGGEDLPLDHGYPARIVVPALPGVHNTKWVARMEFFA